MPAEAARISRNGFDVGKFGQVRDHRTGIDVCREHGSAPADTDELPGEARQMHRSTQGERHPSRAA